MEEVTHYIAAQQLAFATHPFFRWLETTTRRDEVASSFSQLTFWVASLRDVLAINESKIEDTALRELAYRHRRADAGHERWFFEDLHRLGSATLSAEQLFARPTAPIRRAVFGVMSEAFRATDDAARLALLVTLESAGSVFFDATADWAERVAGIFNLKYFSRRDRSTPITAVLLDAIELPPETRVACIGVADRTYDAFFAIFDALLENITLVGQRSLVHFVARYA